MVRKDKLLDGMFKDIANREEMLKVDDLYRKGFKGSAVVYMIKRVKRQWDAMLGKNKDVETIAKPRVIRINQGIYSRLEAIA